MNNKNIFPERLKSLRKSANLTQTDLGEILGMRKSAISMMEKGNSSPTFDTLTALAEYFNVSTDYLAGTGFFSQPLYDEVIKHRAAISKELGTLVFDGPVVEKPLKRRSNSEGVSVSEFREILRNVSAFLDIAEDYQYVSLLSSLARKIDFNPDGSVTLHWTFVPESQPNTANHT